MPSLGLIGPPKILGPPLDLAIPQISFFAQPPPPPPLPQSGLCHVIVSIFKLQALCADISC